MLALKYTPFGKWTSLIKFDYQIYYIKYVDDTTVGLQNEGGNTQICQHQKKVE